MQTQEINNTWSDYLGTLKRRWRPTVAVATFIALGTIYIAYSLPALYESTATILIEEQGIPTDIVQTTVSSYAEQRLQTIYQRITAAPNVIAMIEKFDLYTDERNSVSEDELLNRFRDSTSMSPQNVMSVNARTGREAVITFGFNVSFQASSPQDARNVAQELAEKFVAYNADLRRETTRRTSDFLDSEAIEYEEKLAEVAARIADFKERHGGNLPEDQGVNLTTWERLRDDQIRIEQSIRELQQDKAIFESQIIEVPRFRPVLDGSGDLVLGGTDRLAEAQQELIGIRGRYSESHPRVISLKQEIASLTSSSQDKAWLSQQLRTELDAKTLEMSAAIDKYSESHPDVVRLRRHVASLQQQLDGLEQTAVSASQPNNPAYLQLQTRIRSSEAQIGDFIRRKTEIAGRIIDLENRRRNAPQVERLFSALEQEQDLLQTRYANLRKLGGEAALGDALESGQSGERLTIVDAARLPGAPVSPNRVSLSFLGIVLALAVGLGVASLLDAMDTKVRGQKDIQILLNAPPIGTIPYVEDNSDRVRRIGANVAMAVYMFAAFGFVLSAVF